MEAGRRVVSSVPRVRDASKPNQNHKREHILPMETGPDPEGSAGLERITRRMLSGMAFFGTARRRARVRVCVCVGWGGGHKRRRMKVPWR